MSLKLFFRFVGIISLVSLSSCASVGSNFETSDVKKLNRCVSTRADVVKLLGEPYRLGNQSSYETMQYMYSMAALAGAVSKNSVAIVFLNESDVVIDYAINPVGTIDVRNDCGKK
ncbi:MAG: hypothetical protein NT027_04885 [Proteobacteria bacterium]|nr:hypothetical protein [Pseudomonadota bacterium]